MTVQPASASRSAGRRIRPRAIVVAVALTGAGSLGAAPPPTDPGADAGALDPRIDTDRITEMAPAPLPSSIVLPLPPDHRVAASADQVPMDPVRHRAATAAIARGLDALLARQNADGGWAPNAEATPSDEPDRLAPVSTAITALCVRALAQSADVHPRPQGLRRGLDAILRERRPDGTFADGALANYVNAVVVSALSATDEPERRPTIEGVVAALADTQWDEGEGLRPEQDWYGGAGYGRNGRPDLSNTQMLLEALYDAGVSPDEPAVQRALAFVTRTQNLRGSNPAPWAGSDGGFVYTPANGGESMASEVAGEGRYGERLPTGDPRRLRSYGSMSYAGFKSLLYAGLSADDPRVLAVFDWIRRHYTFDENPGMGRQGLFYYYHAAARALRVGQQVQIPLAGGESRNWRDDLVDAIVSRQRPDGTWRNDAERWLEGEPALATAYAVLALQEALKPARVPRAPAELAAPEDPARSPAPSPAPATTPTPSTPSR